MLENAIYLALWGAPLGHYHLMPYILERPVELMLSSN